MVFVASFLVLYTICNEIKCISEKENNWVSHVWCHKFEHEIKNWVVFQRVDKEQSDKNQFPDVPLKFQSLLKNFHWRGFGQRRHSIHSAKFNCQFKNASETLTAPRISKCFGLPWSAFVCYILLFIFISSSRYQTDMAQQCAPHLE